MRSLIPMMTVSVAVGVLACTAADAPTESEQRPGSTARAVGRDDGGSGALEPEAIPPPMPGLPRYSVPVPASDLTPWSFYAVGEARGTIKNGTITIRYPFPSFINGVEEEVKLEGSYQAGQTHVVVSAGTLGHGTCDLADNVWSCREELPGLPVNAAAARAKMVAAGLSSAEIAHRLEVTAEFSVDPIGIFEMSADGIDDKDADRP